MAIGLKGLFARGIGITGAAEIGFFARGILGGAASVVSSAFNTIIQRRRRRG